MTNLINALILYYFAENIILQMTSKIDEMSDWTW